MRWTDAVYRGPHELKPGDMLMQDGDRPGSIDTATVERIDRPRDFSGRWSIHFTNGWQTSFHEDDRIPVAPPVNQP